MWASNILYGLISDTVARKIRLDSMSHGLVGIDIGHYMTHEGQTWQVQNTIALANDQQTVVHIKTPNTDAYAHWSNTVVATYEFELYFNEGATVSFDGYAIDGYNKNRNSSNVNGVKIYYSPAITAPGKTLVYRRLGAGEVMGGQTGSITEWILKKNTSYTITFISRSGGQKTNYINWYAIWYELLDRD